MKRILFLDWDDLYTILSLVTYRLECKKELLENYSDDFRQDDLVELKFNISKLTRIQNILSDYLIKGITFDENCMPDLESRLLALISDFAKGGASDE